MTDRSPPSEPPPGATVAADLEGSATSPPVESWTGVQRRRVMTGVIAVIIAIGCSAAVFAAVSPILSTPDETAHVDYGYQVWHGELPVFENGVVFRPASGAIPPVHLESQHPPLYYLIIAPVVGPLIDAGHWKVAVLGARAVNVLIAIGCVVALGWAGSMLARRRRWAWAIAVPAVVAPISPFLRVGGSVYSDNLTTLLTILALGLAVQIIRRGPGRWALALTALACAAGALARGNFALTLIVLTVALPIGVLLNPAATGRGRIWKALGAAVLPFAAALLASGWFYLRNIRLTGSWTGGHPEWSIANLGRRERPVMSLVGSCGFWEEQLSLFRQTKDPALLGLGRSLLLVTAVIGLAAMVFWLVRSRRSAAGRSAVDGPRLFGFELEQLAVAAVLAAQALGAEVLQIVYASAGGGIITRYLLPALLPIGAVLAAGVLAFGRQLAGPAYLVYGAIAWGLFLNWAWLEMTAKSSGVTGLTANGIPKAPLWVALALLCVAIVTIAMSLTEWTSRPAPAVAAGPPGDPMAFVSAPRRRPAPPRSRTRRRATSPAPCRARGIVRHR